MRGFLFCTGEMKIRKYVVMFAAKRMSEGINLEVSYVDILY